MRQCVNIGDLVHIPQAVQLIDCDLEEESQLTIPLRVVETKAPKIGVVVRTSPRGYVQVYCDGSRWSVEHQSIYPVITA